MDMKLTPREFIRENYFNPPVRKVQAKLYWKAVFQFMEEYAAYISGLPLPPDEERKRAVLDKPYYGVLEHGCFLYAIYPEQLETHSRCFPLPDARRIISRTLFELDCSAADIANVLGKYLGDRSTVHFQIKSTGVYENKPGYETLTKKLNQMREKFC